MTEEELPQNWIRAKLGDVLPLAYGKGLTEKNRDSAGEFPVYGSSGIVGNHSNALTSKPTLIVGRKGSAGKVFYSEKPCWPIDTVYYCEDLPLVELKYFLYLLTHIRLDKVDNSTAIPSLSRDVYNGIEVPLAPLNEQRRIVSKIEELFSDLDDGEAALRRVQKLLASYRQAVLKAAVTGELTKAWREANQHRLGPRETLLQRILQTRREQWEGRGKYQEPQPPDTSDLPELPSGWIWARMEQLAYVMGGLTKNAKRKSLRLKRPMLRVANVYQNRLELDDIHQIGVTEAELDRVTLQDGDMLIVEGNGSRDQIGRMAIWGNQIPNCIHQNHIIKARFANKRVAKYVMAWFMSHKGREIIEKVASSTSGLYTLSLSKVDELVVPLPSLEEAEELVSQVDDVISRISALENWCKTELVRSATLRQSILKAAFSGQLVPQDANDEPASALLERIQAARRSPSPSKPTERTGAKTTPKLQPTLWEPS